MLPNAGYRGIYVHGQKQRIRRGGTRIEVDANPEDVITVDVPEWQIGQTSQRRDFRHARLSETLHASFNSSARAEIRAA